MWEWLDLFFLMTYGPTSSRLSRSYGHASERSAQVSNRAALTETCSCWITLPGTEQRLGFQPSLGALHWSLKLATTVCLIQRLPGSSPRRVLPTNRSVRLPGHGQFENMRITKNDIIHQKLRHRLLEGDWPCFWIVASPGPTPAMIAVCFCAMPRFQQSGLWVCNLAQPDMERASLEPEAGAAEFGQCVGQRVMARAGNGTSFAGA